MSALAKAYLFSEMDAEERDSAEAALTFMLDDPDVSVRVALAEVLGPAEGAPPHIISTLLCDEETVALPVLEASSSISEGELVDLVATSSAARVCAIARRQPVSIGLAAAICEVAPFEAILELLGNKRAVLRDRMFQRIIDRFGGERSIQDALLAREDLSLPLRHMLIRRYTEELRDHPLVSNGVHSQSPQRLVADAQDRATVALAYDAAQEEQSALIEHLISSHQMTSLLLLRAVCTGALVFFERAVVRLSGVNERHVSSVLKSPKSSTVSALLAKCGLPKRTHPVFVAALEAWALADTLNMDRWGKARLVVTELLDEQDSLELEELGDLQDLLVRLSYEASRESARERVSSMLSAA
ncbi:DUF2336 domain-containing protein [Pseudovibrio exalbescens]|uniref:DUF2336 domain-containing protein n=1 Tax=Pseudovibrio exalbescens TaxID=197461 RepID=UPI0023663465|nr:DUF2336 domain-containing protein [Pseudovibrio exalbescens]MDD7910553.1 DUF2336 domain-containing protein [Pseudovibrio exalbescens]